MAAKKLSAIKLSDVVKRVPKNQMAQFEKFRDKSLEYHRRVNQYPDKLPRIDWDFYRNNVRQDFVKMVEQFQIKYEELDHAFSARQEILDYTKYYAELEKQTAEVKKDVQEFIDRSNSRIAEYEDEIKRISSLIPYENMTVEQFVIYREDVADYIPRQGRPLFWPHTPSEQRVGPANPDYDINLTKSGDKAKVDDDKKLQVKKEAKSDKTTKKITEKPSK